MSGISLLPRHLEYFLALYRRLDYSKAASDIPISYQGLKRAIKTLEGDVDAQLFLQGKDKLVPTPYAEKLYEMTLSWLQEIQDLEKHFNQLKDSERKLVNLCAGLGVRTYFGEHVEEDFEETHPSIKLVIDEFPDNEVDHLLQTGLFNVALMHAPYPEAFNALPAAKQGTCAFIHRNHWLAGRASLSVSDFQDEAVMLPRPYSFKAGDYFLNAFKEQGVETASTIFCSNVMDSFLFALSQKGIGLAPALVCKAFAGQDTVLSIPVSDGCSYEYGIVWRRDHTPTEPEQALISYLLGKE